MAKGIKTGGRQKGSLNKDTLAAIAIFDELDYDPAIEAIKLIKSGLLEPEVAMNAHLKMMKFKYAERKAVEISVEQETIESYEQIIQRLDMQK